MMVPAESRCPRCQAAIPARETFCPRCLLAAAAGRPAVLAEEEIFQQALELERSAREPFIREAARDRPAIGSAALLLLQGYEEAGGDLAPPTFAGPENSHAPSPLSAEEQPGALIHYFRLVRLIGEGGMGSVWQAEQTSPVKRTVALKVIKLGMDTRESVKRFERERQTLALLNHPNIAQVFEAGSTALGRVYFAMELVNGPSITEHCERAELDLKGRLNLFREVCAAVEHAHQKGIIHRDLKPSNILVADGAVKVIDFGVAKATQGAEGTQFTREMQVLGTPAYMSPEQARSAGVDIDTRTDVYALGVLLYEILTGTLPFDPDRLSKSGIAEVQRILTEEDPPTPSARMSALKTQAPGCDRVMHRGESDLHGDLDWVVMKALRKDRSERYQSAAALSAEVERYLAGEPVEAVPPTVAYRASKFVKRHRTAVAAAVLVSFSLAAGTIVSVREAIRANRAKQEATQTLADMYTRSGLAASKDRNPQQAALWFANAAVIANADPLRQQVNLRRAAAWRREIVQPVRALNTGQNDLAALIWNPLHPAMILPNGRHEPCLVWDLESDSLWKPGGASNLARAVWNADGERIAAYREGAVVVVAYPSGEEQARLEVQGTAPALAFSPDDRWLAVGGASGILWEWRTGSKSPLPSANGNYEHLDFHQNGSLLLQTAEAAGICDLSNTPRFRHGTVPNSGRVRARFLPDGRGYLTGDAKGNIAIRDAASGEVVEQYPGANGGWPFAISPDGRFIARENSTLIDREARGPAKFPVHRNIIASGAFSPDGAWYVSAGYDGAATLWALPGGDTVRPVGVHQFVIRLVSYSPNAAWIATEQEGLVKIWRIPQPLEGRRMATAGTSLAALSRDGTLVAAAGYSEINATITRSRVMETSSGKPAGPEIDPEGLIMDAGFSPDNRWLALSVSTTPNRSKAPLGSQAGSGNLQLWDYRSGSRIGEAIPLPSEPRGIAVHPSGEWIAVSCQGGETVEIEVASRRVKTLFQDPAFNDGKQTLANGLCVYTPDGTRLVVYGSYRFLHIWDRKEQRELIDPRRPSMIFDVDFAGETMAMAEVATSSRVEFLNVATGQTSAPAIPGSNWPLRLQFSPDGQLLLSAGGSMVTHIWDWQERRLVCPALPHDDQILSGTFIPGTPWVATGGHDGMIKIWDSRTGMPLCPELQRQSWVLQLKAAPNGRTLVAAGHFGGFIEVFDLEALFPEPELSPEETRLLAEIEAAAEVHPGGDIVPLSSEGWLERWQNFRQRHPDFRDHLMSR